MKTAVLLLAALPQSTALQRAEDFLFSHPFGLIAVTLLFLAAVLLIAAGIISDRRRQHRVLDRALKYFENHGGSLDFPVAAVITDDKGHIVWYNTLFSNGVLRTTVPEHGNISSLISGDTPFSFCRSGQGTDISYEGREYTVYAESLDRKNSAFCFFFIDNTELKKTADEYYSTRPVVMHLKIDNLEEVYQNYKNSECEMISGELEHILEAWASAYSCIFRRVSSSLYFCLIDERGFASVREAKFDILKQVRDYKYGLSDKNVEITLSVGVGRGGNLPECDENAREALEMSQSRGGDQVTVNTAGSFEFFGGTVSGSTKRSRVKARVTATALADLIKSSDRVFVTGHCFSDLDSVGAAAGIYEAAAALDKKCFAVINRQTSMAEALIGLLEKEAMQGAFIDEKKALKDVSPGSLLIITDTHRADNLDYPKLLDGFKKRIVIDHHRRTADYISPALLYYDEPNASSACELVTELIQYLPVKVKLHPLCAQALLSGIMLDTRNFILSAGSRTFEAAAYLKANGADTLAVRRFSSDSLEGCKLRNEIMSTAQRYKSFILATAPKNTEKIRLTASLAADELLNISGVKASFVLFAENGQINISARSLGEVNVQLITERLGGGGHLTMAAAQLKGVSLTEAITRLKELLDEYDEEYEEADFGGK